LYARPLACLSLSSRGVCWRWWLSSSSVGVGSCFVIVLHRRWQLLQLASSSSSSSAGVGSCSCSCCCCRHPSPSALGAAAAAVVAVVVVVVLVGVGSCSRGGGTACDVAITVTGNARDTRQTRVTGTGFSRVQIWNPYPYP